MATTVSAVAGVTGITLAERAAAAGRRLPIPDMLVPTERDGVTVFPLRLGYGTHELLPGVSSRTAGFNGSYLGPTVRVRNGQRVRMEVTNDLDEDVAVHWHGAHVPPEDDGGVHAAFPPGETWKPEFTIKQEAATLWYHPHTMGRTAAQIAMGLAGMLIVDDGSKASSSLPGDYGTDDIPVIMQSVAVGDDGDIRSEPLGRRDGDVSFPLVVNGATVDDEPLTFTATKGRVRLRLLNASLADVLTVARADGRPLEQVATESAFLDRPTRVDRVRLVAACRAEIVVDVAEEVALNVTVQTGLRRGGNGTHTFLRLLPGSTRRKLRALPSRLNNIHRFDVSGVKPRTIALSDRRGLLGINGVSGQTMEAMDHNMIVVREGDLEVWDIVNQAPGNHSFHVHDVPFQLVSINGRRPHGVELGWRDTIEIPHRARVRIALRFTDFASEKYTYMLHCHMAQHEDLGMMTSLMVKPR
ncbi:multicopper oxidase family protein [Streptomyces sp. NPDC092296]|uniref:multicopper oxidase family protein n=1 Tax=Streptomyces sp. NPDC092296 TaxID=3366012 RepID=UPI0037FFE561